MQGLVLKTLCLGGIASQVLFTVLCFMGPSNLRQTFCNAFQHLLWKLFTICHKALCGSQIVRARVLCVSKLQEDPPASGYMREFFENYEFFCHSSVYRSLLKVSEPSTRESSCIMNKLKRNLHSQLSNLNPTPFESACKKANGIKYIGIIFPQVSQFKSWDPGGLGVLGPGVHPLVKRPFGCWRRPRLAATLALAQEAVLL